MKKSEDVQNQGSFSLEITEKTIDLKSVIHSKSPKLSKALPWFVLNYLRRIIHENLINEALWKNKDKQGIDFARSILSEIGVETTVINPENIPKTGRYLIASNHPLGGPDGLALMSEIGKIRQDIIFPVNDLLMFLPNVRELFIPINKHGKNIDNIKIINDTFASDKLIVYFPAGLVSRRKKGKIEDPEWKITFLSKAVKYKRDIIPVFVSGRNSNFFYNLSNFRKFLGIKTNIEMLYLMDELVKQKNKPISITFGKPISYQTFDKSKKMTEWTQLVKQQVYALGNNQSLPIK